MKKYNSALSEMDEMKAILDTYFLHFTLGW